MALYLALVPAGWAHSVGRIAGSVTDAGSGEPLPGANVIVGSAGLGTTTDAHGRYELSRVPAGQVDLRVSLIGYATADRQVDLAAGEQVAVDVALEASPIHLSEMLVQSDRALSAASSRAVRDFDLQVRPRRTSQQMLQMAPGLIVAQHAGGGKAEQIYLRNFDCDHGTDVAISVDGIPVNMVSHGHGQGYADMHFLIPDVVAGLDVYKGPYFAEYGNLATAGAVAFRTRSHLEESAVRVEAGSFNTVQYTTLLQLPLADADNSAYFAGSYYRTDGAVDDPQGFQRLNVFAKVHAHLSARSTLTLDAAGFSSAWDASGQIPQRAVASGLIDRWGSIDPLEGGTTGRQSLNLAFLTRGGDNSEFAARAYVTRYEFKLFSDFTLFRQHPVEGDMIEQTDDRVLMGMNSTYSRYHSVGDLLAQATLGGGLRADNADVALWHSPDRVRADALVEARVLERDLSLWGQEQIFLSPRLRLVIGLRGDYFTFDVEDRLEGLATGLPHASGYAQESILSPKAGLVLTPTRDLDLFLNLGTGFHSNDARGVVIDRRAADVARAMRLRGATQEQIDAALAASAIDPEQLRVGTLPRAIGGEVGLRARMAAGVNLGAAAWWLDLDEELVWVGDAGTAEPSGKTRRYGLDLEGRVQLLPWLWADADVTLSSGKLVDEPSGADHIPLAPNLTSQGGLSARHPAGWEGSLRFRHIGDRPANEDDTVTALGYAVLDASADYRWSRYKVQAVVENLLDTEWNEAQFDTQSRLPGEAAPVSELHYTPGNPRGLRLGVSYLF